HVHRDDEVGLSVAVEIGGGEACLQSPTGHVARCMADRAQNGCPIGQYRCLTPDALIVIGFLGGGFMYRLGGSCRPARRAAVNTCILALCAMALGACGGGGGSGAPVDTTSTFERIQTQVFDVSCSSDSCHSSIGHAGGLVLEAGYSWDELANHV